MIERTQPLVQHISPFNRLTSQWIPEMIRDYAGIDTVFEENDERHRYVITVDNYRCIRQKVGPDECHRRNMNYAVDIMVDIRMNVYRLPPLGNPDKRELSVKTVIKEVDKKRRMELLDDALVEEELQKERDETNKQLVYTDELLDHILFSLPNMLHSSTCILSDACGQQSRIQGELGGSFIMRGKRRFIPFMEHLKYNIPFFFMNKGVHNCEVRSEHLDRKFRSTSSINIVLTPAKRSRKMVQSKKISVEIPFLKPQVPLHVLVLAFGWTFDQFEESMYRMDVDPSMLKNMVSTYMNRMRYMHYNCETQDQAIFHIAGLYKRYDDNAAKLRRSILNTLHSEVFPHLNHVYSDSDKKTADLKMRYLSWLCALLFRFGEGQIPMTDRDSYEHIVLDGASELIALLFRQLITNFTRQGVKAMRRVLRSRPKKKSTGCQPVATGQEQESQHERVKLPKVYNAHRLTPKLMSAVSTGRWSDDRKGISHAMKTTNSMICISQLRRVSSSYLGNQGKHIGPRMTHPTSYGYVCAAETPEGEPCGLVYTLASTAIVTPHVDPRPLMLLLLRATLSDIYVPLDVDAMPDPNHWKLIGPQGVLWGWVTDAQETIRRVRRLRRSCAIEKTTSVSVNLSQHAVYIHTAAGRLSRPLFVMENIHKLSDLLYENRHRHSQGIIQSLLEHGVIEYLDAAECYCTKELVSVAIDCRSVRPFDTHMEISQAAFVGICASFIPLFNKNQGPRVVYQIGMGKQYMSPLALDDSGSNTSHLLHTGQVPLVRTIVERDDACEGLNLVVAICPHPRAQEDALVIKLEAVQRGAYQTTTIKTYTATHTPRNANQPQDRFERPGPLTFGRKHGVDYSKVGENGLPKVGTVVNVGDVLIGKTIPNMSQVSSSARVKVPQEFHDPTYQEYRRDASVYVGKGQEGVVHEVIEEPGIRKVRVRSFCTASKGDKFSNRHGQKGTVGILEEAINMPFSESSGIIPDVIIGPTSIPSRMTMGMILEMILGKAVAISGRRDLGIDKQLFDAALTEENIAEVGRILVQHGFQASGRERMRDGMTGELLEVEVFMGVIHYGIMDHKVKRKVHARAAGQLQDLTRQPTEGRSNGGGFRLGALGIDVLTAHGVSSILQERTVTVSDEVELFFCKQCGFVGDANASIGLYVCRHCNTSKHMRSVKQSKSANVMFNELASTGISTRYLLRDIE